MPETPVYKTFIAFTFDEQSQTNLAQLQLTLKPRLKTVRWMNPDQFHITAAYLDMLDINQVTKVAIAIQEIKEKYLAINAKITDLEAFPAKQNAKIIYARVGGNNLIYFLDVVQQIREKLIQEQIDFDTKPFLPHITLGRAKTPQNITRYKHLSTSNKITISEMAVYISQHVEGGFQYKEIKV